MRKIFFVFFTLLCFLSHLKADDYCCDWPRDFRFNYCCDEGCWSLASGYGPVDVAPAYSVDMLSRLHFRPIKQLVLLQYTRCVPCQQAILSAQLRASAFYAHSNSNDKFGYLGRFPMDFRKHNASEVDINDFTLAVTYSPVTWVHGYWEFLHADHIAFTHDPRQGCNQTHKVYAVLGDFEKTPFYFTIGKRDIGFGAMYTVNPFTPSVTWHYFGPLADCATVGYYDGNFHVEASAINGGRGVRVADTNEIGRIDNWALNGSYRLCWGDWNVSVGAGYLYSTIYDGPIAEHEGPISVGHRNAIWDVNLEICNGAWRNYFEFCTTEHPWPTTNHRVSTFSFGTSYCLVEPWLCNPVILSAEYGEGIQGPHCVEWHANTQLVLGVDYHVRHNARFCFEYIRVKGFAPLIHITRPGVSDQGALENVLLVGLTLNI